MTNSPYVKHSRSEAHAGASPWSVGERLRILLWEFTWLVLCQWTPKPANPWRLVILRAFGCRIHGRPFVHQRARILIPWNLTLHDRACIGDRANAYSLGEIVLGESCTVAQEAYLCTGTHDFTHSSLPLLTAMITVGSGAFIGARAFVLPGVTIGEKAVVGAASVVTKSVLPRMVVAGNPAVSLHRSNGGDLSA